MREYLKRKKVMRENEKENDEENREKENEESMMEPKK